MTQPVDINTSPHAPSTHSRHTKRLSLRIYEYLASLGSFVGPGYMVAVGYLDPGNWATDLAAGSQFGYKLLFIIFLSNFMAILLQSLCVRLGISTGLDLAQACNKHFSKPISLFLYVLCEIAIISTDLAEVIGSAIALNLLFGIPLIIGVLVTSLDVFVVLFGYDSQNFRRFELLIFGLVAVTAGCLLALVAKSGVEWAEVVGGFMPSKALITDPAVVYAAVGIIGATIMPHNLYLHSSIVKLRSDTFTSHTGTHAPILLAGFDAGVSDTSTNMEAGEIDDESALLIVDTAPIMLHSPSNPLPTPLGLSQAISFSIVDTIVALMFAVVVNCAILIISSANLYTTNHRDVAELDDAFYLISERLGAFAGVLFAVALLLAGQSSTITGTITGQIVMEGFLGDNFVLEPWMRRLITRSLAILPAVLVILIYGEQQMGTMLIASQVVLSLQLPFAIWPLVYFTAHPGIMNKQPGTMYHNSLIINLLSVICALALTAFNFILIYQSIAHA